MTSRRLRPGLCCLGEFDGSRGVVCSDAGDHFAAASDGLDGCFDDRKDFVVAQSAGFTGCSAGNDTVNTTFDLELDERLQCMVVNPVFTEWGYDCCVNAAEHIDLAQNLNAA